MTGLPGGAADPRAGPIADRLSQALGTSERPVASGIDVKCTAPDAFATRLAYEHTRCGASVQKANMRMDRASAERKP
jgi:hypothetical protein